MYPSFRVPTTEAVGHKAHRPSTSMGGAAPLAELLPAGNINTPSAKLQVEWFYMTFHKTDRVEYVRSGRKLREENLQTLTKYFESIYDTQAIKTTYS